MKTITWYQVSCKNAPCFLPVITMHDINQRQWQGKVLWRCGRFLQEEWKMLFNIDTLTPCDNADDANIAEIDKSHYWSLAVKFGAIGPKNILLL